MAIRSRPTPGTTFGATLGTLGGSTSFPLNDPGFSFGGCMQVASTAARNAIPLANLQNGMLVWVEATDTYYKLAAAWAGTFPTVDGDWDVLIAGSPGITGSASPELIAYGSTITPGALTANVNFSRSNTTSIVNNEQGYNLGVNTTTTRYIDPAGNDANNGLTALTPWQTRQHALDEMEAYLPGSYQIIAANGTYSEDFVPPYNSIGRAIDSGGTIVDNIGDEAVPANSVVAGGSIYENDLQGRGYSGNMRFAGISFVGDNSGDAITTSAGITYIRNCQFTQVDACGNANFNALVFFEPSTTGGTASNINQLAQSEDGGLVYVGTSYTITGLQEGLALSGLKSTILFGDNLTFNCTGTGGGSNSFIRAEGAIGLGAQNTFVIDNAVTPIQLSRSALIEGGQDNQMDFVNCTTVGDLRDNALFVTSEAGTGSYTVSGSTPATRNFSLDGQSAVLNELNSTTGNREIPMTWFTAPALASTDYVLATDWRYKTSDSVTLPGRLLPSTSGWLTSQGISDICVPIYIAQKPEVFSRFTVKYRLGNGATATDTYTVYVNGTVTTMSGVITNGTSVTVTVNPQVLDVGDEVSIFVAAHATTTAEDISVAY